MTAGLPQEIAKALEGSRRYWIDVVNISGGLGNSFLLGLIKGEPQCVLERAQDRLPRVALCEVGRRKWRESRPHSRQLLRYVSRTRVRTRVRQRVGRLSGGRGRGLSHWYKWHGGQGLSPRASGSHTRSASSTAGSSVSGGRSPSSARRAPPSRLQSPRPRKSTAQSDEDDEDEARPSHSVHISRPPCFVVRAAPSLHASFSSCRSTGSAAARRASSPSRSARAATPSETFASVRRPSPLLPHSSLSCACPA